MIKSQELPFKKHPDAPEIQQIFQTLESKGFEVRIVGGAVRDWLMNRPPKDLDLATTATPDDIEKIFPQTKPIGKAFGVMMVIINRKGFEVATFREEGPYEDGRRPEGIIHSTPEKDVLRRDFTVNGLLYHPGQQKIWDFVGGLQDLTLKQLRTIGPPDQRFQEDHLRVLRAYRFRAQLGLRWETELELSLKNSSALLSSVSRERIREEILRLFDGDFREPVIADLVQNHVLATIFPGIRWKSELWKPWPKFDGSALLELADWARACGANDSNLKQLGESLKLANQQQTLLQEGLWLYQNQNRILTTRLGLLIEKFWIPAFDQGFKMWRKDPAVIAEASLLKKLEEAVRIHKEWTQGKTEMPESPEMSESREKPDPWVKASDLPEFQGRALGDALKEAWFLQLEKQCANQHEILQRMKTQK